MIAMMIMLVKTKQITLNNKAAKEESMKIKKRKPSKTDLIKLKESFQLKVTFRKRLKDAQAEGPKRSCAVWWFLKI